MPKIIRNTKQSIKSTVIKKGKSSFEIEKKRKRKKEN